jgi:predicted nucleic acid-binding protein
VPSTARTDAHVLLDTDVASYIYSDRAHAEPYLTLILGHAAAISFVTIGEMLRGALGRRWSPRRIANMEQHLAETYVTLPYSQTVARTWAPIMTACSSRGVTVTENDAWIAAVAADYGCALVTNDRIFARISDAYPALRLVTPPR